MKKSDSLLGAAAPGFDEPLEMLRACHGRIEAQCATLDKLLAHLQRAGADEQARQAAAAVLRYFDSAGRQHHADEEEDLFPALLESVPPARAAAAQALVFALRAEHEAMDVAWRALRQSLQRIVAGEGALLSPEWVADFTGRYRHHMETENTRLLPLAEQTLSPQQREALGRAMAERRGVRP